MIIYIILLYMPQQECSKNDIFSIKNTPNLTVNTVYDSYK